MKVFAEKILSHYHANKRELPWRNTNDPYLIWLSEIILQQTRVDQGMSYYYKFAENFPTVKHLAEADEEKVLKLWQGLGYYSRARNLHAAAKVIVADHKGVFPNTYEEILKLKGIGSYTAAAIASFAFNKCYAVVDGNVYRVLSRVFGIGTPIDSTQGKKEFEALATRLIDKKNPGTYNQAIMEFGATQCKPKNPDCKNCPLNMMCKAYSDNTIHELPVKAKTLKSRDRYFNYLIIKDKNSILINKRRGKDIWENLYDFPLIETKEETGVEKILELKEFQNVVGKEKFTVENISKIYKHVLSHQKIYARFIELKIKDTSTNKRAETLAIDKKEIGKYAVPRLIETYLEDRMSLYQIS